MTENKNLTEDEKAILESQETDDVVRASRGQDNWQPSKRLNDLTDNDHVVKLNREDSDVEL